MAANSSVAGQDAQSTLVKLQGSVARVQSGAESSSRQRCSHSPPAHLAPANPWFTEYVQLLTHRSVATTADIYVHLGADDVRAELARRGIWRREEGR